jgi:hypothetical protein
MLLAMRVKRMTESFMPPSSLSLEQANRKIEVLSIER